MTAGGSRRQRGYVVLHNHFKVWSTSTFSWHDVLTLPNPLCRHCPYSGEDRFQMYQRTQPTWTPPPSKCLKPWYHTYGDYCSKPGPFHVTDHPSCFHFCHYHNKQDIITTDSLTRILNTMLFFGLFYKSRFKSLCCPERQPSKVLSCKDKVLFHHQISTTF